jgi:hypothetical protein
MLQVQVADPEASQRLLDETKKVFGHMQATWLKSVDTQGLVDTIRTYENEPIDVSIQMDVDEFYNLLFDRWEAQIVDPEAKKKFRSFYGGQLVQQIKSKECPHISERLEPFSAIQCDIKGKASLEESLQAYVEGEVMQGGEYCLQDSGQCILTYHVQTTSTPVRPVVVTSMLSKGELFYCWSGLAPNMSQSLLERYVGQSHIPSEAV